MRHGPKIARARQLRRTMSVPEVKLWTVLRTRPDGFKFRRQHPVGPYIADFYCAEARLAVEVDGSRHGTAWDEARDAYFSAQAIETMRVPSKVVMVDLDAVVRGIMAECRIRVVG